MESIADFISLKERADRLEQKLFESSKHQLAIITNLQNRLKEPTEEKLDGARQLLKISGLSINQIALVMRLKPKAVYNLSLDLR